MYLVVNSKTNKAWGKSFYQKASYELESSAKAMCTRLNKKGDPVFVVMSSEQFRAIPVKMVERVNLMSGEKFMEAEDTPNFCSPSSETYWSS